MIILTAQHWTGTRGWQATANVHTFSVLWHTPQALSRGDSDIVEWRTSRGGTGGLACHGESVFCAHRDIRRNPRDIPYLSICGKTSAHIRVCHYLRMNACTPWPLHLKRGSVYVDLAVYIYLYVGHACSAWYAINYSVTLIN